MSARRAQRMYALLLRAYPADFRAAYGREMSLLFRTMTRDAGGATIGVWMEIVRDVARTAPTLRIEAFRAQWNFGFGAEERRMKPMGFLAILIGFVQIVNASIELTAGGAVLGAFPRFAVLMAIAVALLLVAAGTALVRRSPRAPTLATAAAVAWLVLAGATRAVHPWMSIFTMLLAVVFPLALLVFVWARRGESVTQ